MHLVNMLLVFFCPPLHSLWRPLRVLEGAHCLRIAPVFPIVPSSRIHSLRAFDEACASCLRCLAMITILPNPAVKRTAS